MLSNCAVILYYFTFFLFSFMMTWNWLHFNCCICTVGMRSVLLMLSHWGLPLTTHFNIYRSRQEQLLRSNLMVCSPSARRVTGRNRLSLDWFGIGRGIEFLNIQIITFVAWIVRVNTKLDGMSTVSPLSVKFASFMSGAYQWFQKLILVRSIWLENCLSLWVEAKVGLVH